jgi:fructosamine-3-kinase
MNSTIESIIDSAGLGPVQNSRRVSGGSINEAFEVETDSEMFFLKVNSASRHPSMFETESAGLLLLSESDFIVPKPKLVGVKEDTQFILMEWIEQGPESSDFWNEFGRSLANLHLQNWGKFGLDHDNYIGSLRQTNNWQNSWSEFYTRERLIPQMELAAQNGRLSANMKTGFEIIFKKLEDIYSEEKPSLLHGDLWSGNLMVSSKGSPCIFDPAIYYGHREMDLAMMALFGGFGDEWVDSYNEIYPLENGWEERLVIGQLYPLMVHVNLFGGTYARSVESILQKFM